MKTLLSLLKWTLIILAVAVAGLYLSGNGYLIKGIWATYLHGEKSATIGDAKYFETRTIEAGNAKPWALSTEYNKLQLSSALRSTLEDNRSVAFLMLQGGELLYEEYWDGYSAQSHSNSFSMAKSITTMLTQCAIQDGTIKSWDQKATDFLPNLQGEYANKLTLRHLSTMTAGLEFNEHYTSPFSITAPLYYGNDVEQLLMDRVPVSKQPGTFEYQSGATQLLGLCIMKATGMHLADYASQKLWKPLGAEHNAKWHLDTKDGTELAFCCFNTNARDFARFGQLMLNNGTLNGTRILDSAFVHMATQPYATPYYGHGFWLYGDEGTPVFYQRGILGQYVIVIPEFDVVVVRLGHTRGEIINNHDIVFRGIMREVMAMLRGGVDQD